ncbi:MAG: hypothetical protein ABIJ16_10665, partial [Bacteroidota bacterium]
VLIGASAGSKITSGSSNVIIGSISGEDNTIGTSNVFVGAYSGQNNTSGYSNLFIGYGAGLNNTTGFDNVFIGQYSGFNNSVGKGNIFIGDQAGYFETGDNKLYIDNSSTTSPLIYGDMSTNKVTLNDVLILTPRNTPPATPVEGEIYFDASDHKLKVFDGTIWTNCN